VRLGVVEGRHELKKATSRAAFKWRGFERLT